MPTPSTPELDRARWAEIARAANEIQLWTQGLSEAAYRADGQVCAATAMNLLIIGEAARRLSDEAKAQFPNLQWPAIIALRNRIAHGYASIDHSRVWLIVQHELSDLAAIARAASHNG